MARLKILLDILLLSGVLALGFMHFRDTTNLRTTIEELQERTEELQEKTVASFDALEWTTAQRNYTTANSLISPKVGIIQFLNRGYSITLNSVQYKQEGLLLEGVVGNPTNITLTNLTLNFTAIKPVYTSRERFLKNTPYWPESFIPDDLEFDFSQSQSKRLTPHRYLSPDKLGEAQASPIGSLRPGQQESFSVTIPNVEQTKDGVSLIVSFSGARYSY